MTTPRIPPTEAELEEWEAVAGTPVPVLTNGYRLPEHITGRLIREVRRLRALCGEAARHPWRVSQLVDARLRMRLEKAEKREV